MDRSEAQTLLQIKDEWDEVGSDLRLPGGQVRAGSPPGSHLTVPASSIDPFGLQGGELILLTGKNSGTAGLLEPHSGSLVSRLKEKGYPVDRIRFIEASELERMFAKTLVELALL